MNSLKTGSKRARPLLGTTVSIEVDVCDGDMITSAFCEIERLTKIFNFHDVDSELSRFNRTAEGGSEFEELLKICKTLELQSEGAFSPYRDGRLDLSGIAKGYIVDRAVEWIKTRQPDAAGCINAGGDLKFFGQTPRSVELRLGNSFRAFVQSVALIQSAVATSAINAFRQGRTAYFQTPRSPIVAGFTVSVQAPTLTAADALTKIVLFGTSECIERCCRLYDAKAFVFDCGGTLTEDYGFN